MKAGRPNSAGLVVAPFIGYRVIGIRPGDARGVAGPVAGLVAGFVLGRCDLLLALASAMHTSCALTDSQSLPAMAYFYSAAILSLLALYSPF